ncbi:MBL fold metallo-hydrolase [Amycolatopsis rhabdoformis]|uniref:MBL fold metallo-hydrolase n=1 Tax=Amycolatopsis rhabdoformis TaxID=1448059 RepID=A0ABZ1IJ87_9PSEU|nr:MBL fold metallo-hydrolase [Amycolatopsis rhabdoformis]WSE33475.1 MBL fold metallo-hydrolase [Amycolatopsis rhabdoformis]
MLVVGFAAGPLRANCYLLAPAAGGECVVVDPGQDSAEPLAAALAEHGLTPVVLLATHGHPDHVAGALGHDLPLHLHPADHDWFTGRAEPLAEGRLAVAGLDLDVVPLPGHTPGSVAFGLRASEGGRLVLTGDTLFAGSIGRTDGPGAELEKSLRTKLLTLPDDTVVLPGHGPATTIGRERATNPALVRA